MFKMVPETPRFTVHRKPPATFPGKQEHPVWGSADPGSAAGSRQGGGARPAQRQEAFSPSQSPGWTGSPCASLLAAGGHWVDMDHWRGVYGGGVEPATLASGQQGNCLCQGFAETQTWWKRDRGSRPKGHSGLFFIFFVMFLATSVLRTVQLFPQN